MVINYTQTRAENKNEIRLCVGKRALQKSIILSSFDRNV